MKHRNLISITTTKPSHNKRKT